MSPIARVLLFLRHISKYPLPRRVGQQRPAAVISQRQQVVRALEHRPELFLALAQGLLSPLELGDVRHHAQQHAARAGLVADDGGLVTKPRYAPVARHHAVFGGKWLPGLVAAGHIGQHALAVLGVHQPKPEVGVRGIFLLRAAQQGLDLGADVEGARRGRPCRRSPGAAQPAGGSRHRADVPVPHAQRRPQAPRALRISRAARHCPPARQCGAGPHATPRQAALWSSSGPSCVGRPRRVNRNAPPSSQRRKYPQSRPGCQPQKPPRPSRAAPTRPSYRGALWRCGPSPGPAPASEPVPEGAWAGREAR